VCVGACMRECVRAYTRACVFVFVCDSACTRDGEVLVSCSCALSLCYSLVRSPSFSLPRSFAPSHSRFVSLLFFRPLDLPLSFFHFLALSLYCIFALKFRHPIPFALSPFRSLVLSLSRSCVLSLCRSFTLSFFRSLALPSLALSRSHPPALSFPRSCCRLFFVLSRSLVFSLSCSPSRSLTISLFKVSCFTHNTAHACMYVPIL